MATTPMATTPMVFSLRAIDSQGQQREFAYHIHAYESGLDVLSMIVAQGSILLEAQMLEGNKVIELPLEVFDGTSFSDVMQGLEQEWQCVLNQPAESTEQYADEYIQLTHQIVDQHQTHTAHLEEMRTQVDKLLPQTDIMAGDPPKGRLVSYSATPIDSLDARLVRINLLLKRTFGKLISSCCLKG
jgi:hypothetical protein